MSHLERTLGDVQEKKPWASSEDLYKLNEAIFNLGEKEEVSPDTAAAIVSFATRTASGFSSGRAGSKDDNFRFDIVGLLATCQNQHFFDDAQIQKLRQALLQVLASDKTLEHSKGKGADVGDIARLRAENDSMRELAHAVCLIQNFRPAQRQQSVPSDPSRSSGDAVKACKVVTRNVTARKIQGFMKDVGEERPAAGDLLVLQATMRLLENRDSSPPWPKVQVSLSDAAAFCTRLKEFNPDEMSPAVTQGLGKLVAKEEWPVEGGGVIAALRDWVKTLAGSDTGPSQDAVPSQPRARGDRRRRAK